MTARTLYAKLWDSHVVTDYGDGTALLYIDRHLLHEVSTHQAFAALRATGRVARRPEANLAVPDHAVPTEHRDRPMAGLAGAQVARLAQNAADFHIPYIDLTDPRQGIVHVVGPELGFTLPGISLVCGDSHTSTHGAFGALAFGIGQTDCATVLATQCIVQARAATMVVRIDGMPSPWVGAKDIALALIGQFGAGYGIGHAVEYVGPAVSAMSMAARMTLCNMAIEAGARVGLVAPDTTTFAFLRGLLMAPAGAAFDAAEAYWRTLPTDAGARYDRELSFDISSLAPQVTWGTNPQDVVPVGGVVPDLADTPDDAACAHRQRSLDYMGLTAGAPMTGLPIDRVFIGSCTNGRIEDLRDAARVAAGRHVAPTTRALVVPGSMAVRRQAEAEGLDRIFLDAGFEWREAGCSMCVAMNDDRLAPGERCASTSNRNFEGRQGRGGRTHLMNPAMAAAAAIAGRLVDVRDLGVGA
ncbi:3-isopropylmalate dehydratase large subunit [Polymorphobacter sp. PAMC 29334]|uniref:3-isopropylmalate dehydratase large subunit n=1 Tax=Polymorphobacter sp. PAMC 29334 TaxID=2862331 RepID=UPI001C79808B|nr:3-isopropylmalate dehydratase large subunit [Polymorphobacter sp. PAMC 29334]QYE33936.1 3-isopropylmalate dehydratase large subunit [Polymorphobacter sp. PAMC 29334]